MARKRSGRYLERLRVLTGHRHFFLRFFFRFDFFVGRSENSFDFRPNVDSAKVPLAVGLSVNTAFPALLAFLEAIVVTSPVSVINNRSIGILVST